MPRFVNVTPAEYENQKGVDIEIQCPGDQLITINVYVDVIEECLLKAEMDGEVLLHTSIDAASYVPALFSFSDDETYLYVKYDRHELHIKLEGEGIVLDVWEMQGQEGECIDTSNLMFAELEV